MRIPFISLLAAGALSLGGCAYGDFGLGYGGGYGGYGYGAPTFSVGLGSSYGGYGAYPYGGYGYGYGDPYYGWYNDYYYPGSGYYVYDTARRPYAMNRIQRDYWSHRSPALRAQSATRTEVRPNWSGFEHRGEHGDRAHDGHGRGWRDSHRHQ